MNFMTDKPAGLGCLTPRAITKELDYALKEGQHHGWKLATVGAAVELFDQAVAVGKADQEFSAIVELVGSALFNGSSASPRWPSDSRA